MINGFERVIFVNFLPGSFGSFLTHCISFSPDVFTKTATTDIFDEVGGAHRHIREFLKEFHTEKHIHDWSLVDIEQQENIIKNQWHPPQEFLLSNKYHVHRVLGPKYIPDLLRFFSKSKFVNITIKPEHISLIRDMYAKKGSHVLKNNVSSPYHYYLMKQYCDTIEKVYNFDVSFFLNGNFLQEYEKLMNWLGLHKADVSELYENFKKVNNL